MSEVAVIEEVNTRLNLKVRRNILVNCDYLFLITTVV